MPNAEYYTLSYVTIYNGILDGLYRSDKTKTASRTTEVEEPQRQDKTSQIHVSNPDMAILQNARPSGKRTYWLRTSLRA